MPTAVYRTATGECVAAVKPTYKQSYPLLISTHIGSFRQEDPAVARAYNPDGSLYLNLDGDGYPVKDATVLAAATITGAGPASPGGTVKPAAPIALGWSDLCALYDYRRPDDARQARYKAGISAVAELAAEFADVHQLPATSPTAIGGKCVVFGGAINQFNAAMAPLLPTTPHPTITALALAVNRVRMAANRAFGAASGCGSRETWASDTGAALRDLDVAVALAITMTDMPAVGGA